MNSSANGVQVTSPKDYLYSKVKPKHLRNSLPEHHGKSDREREQGGRSVSEKTPPPKPQRTLSRQNSTSDSGRQPGEAETQHSNDAEISRKKTGPPVSIDSNGTSREDSRVPSSQTLPFKVVSVGGGTGGCRENNQIAGSLWLDRGAATFRSGSNPPRAMSLRVGKADSRSLSSEKIDWCPPVLRETGTHCLNSRALEHDSESHDKVRPDSSVASVKENAMRLEEGAILAHPTTIFYDELLASSARSMCDASGVNGDKYDIGEEATSVPVLDDPHLIGSLSLDGSDGLSTERSHSPVPAVADESMTCELDSIDVLKTCAFCQQPCSDLKLLLCFHTLCSECAAPIDADGSVVIVCRLCNQSHAFPREGVIAWKDLYPGLLNQYCIRPQLSDSNNSSTIEENGSLHKSEGMTSTKDAEEVPLVAHGDFSVTQDPSVSPQSGPQQISDAADLPRSAADEGNGCEQQRCGACKASAEAQFLCMICGVLMCKACRTAHENLPVTRCHEVVHVSSGGPSPLKLLESFQPSCAHHGRDLAYACATCGVFACHRCLMPSHVEHEVVDLTSLRQSKRKACSTLQRALKQHALSVKSTRRRLEERLARTSKNCRALCDAIQACASHSIDQIATRASEMKKSVRLVLKARKEGLEKDLLQLQQVERDGNRLRCVLSAITQKTPHLTSLTLLHTCQAKFEALQQQRPLQSEDLDCLAFCKNPRMEAELLGESLGSVRHVRQALSEKVVTLVRVFQTGTKLSSLAVTPYGEIVCVSRFCATCHVWDDQGVLLVDASHHVTQPTCVEVTPDGVIVVLDVSSNGGNRSTSACLKFLSPAGSFLSEIDLPCDPDRTWFHVPDGTRVLVSDGASRKVTMVGLDQKNRSMSCVLHTVQDEALLSCPRHVAMTITEDLLVSDGGTTLRVISPGGHISTLLTEDEPFTALAECDGTAQRALISVCCDRHGRVLAADSSKCGLYIITGACCREGERHFVSLREASSACTRLTAMTVCRRQGLIFVAMEDGQISILRLGNSEDSDDSDGDNYVNLLE